MALQIPTCVVFCVLPKPGSAVLVALMSCLGGFTVFSCALNPVSV